jgi:hypothetical protein
MRTLAALLVTVCAVAAFAANPSPEAVRFESGTTFFSLPRLSPFKAAPRVAAPARQAAPLFQVLDPKPRRFTATRSMGDVVGTIDLKPLLDHHRDLLKGKTLGAKPYDISVAGDAGFKNYFLTFQQAGSLLIAPLGDLNRLRGEGVDIQIEPGVVYNFKVSINIFDPVRGSTLQAHAVRGTRGPNHDIKTGTVLDLVKEKSAIFNADGNEYWVLHGTDVDPATNKLVDSRSLLFIHEAGMSTKAWPVAESALPAGQPTTVSFGDNQYVLTRSADGRLTIASAN